LEPRGTAEKHSKAISVISHKGKRFPKEGVPKTVFKPTDKLIVLLAR
jgi:pyocin large subunit-like protein